MLEEEPFDTMVVDEASMMPIPMLACMGMIGLKRLVVAGDFRQLGPIAVSQSRASFDWLHKDAFELAGISQNLDHSALEMLTVQRRMHPHICDLVNRHIYGGKLSNNPDPVKLEASALAPLPGIAAVFVVRLPEDGSLKENQLPTQQADRIKIGTVHAFQGAEANVIIWDMVDTGNHPVGRLYRGDTGNRLANVAISRAQGKLLLIGDIEAFLSAPGYQAVERLRNILPNRFSRSAGNIVRVNDLNLD